jgi:hypothetical protein
MIDPALSKGFSLELVNIYGDLVHDIHGVAQATRGSRRDRVIQEPTQPWCAKSDEEGYQVSERRETRGAGAGEFCIEKITRVL